MDNQDAEVTQARIKMYRGSDRLVVAAAMAGMQPEDIEVEVTSNGLLKLTGRVVGELKGETEVLLDEWNPGPYQRTVELPSAVDGGLANVTYRNGVLVVALPLSSEMHAARISLARVGPAYGERIASHGRPVEPTTSEEHHAPGIHLPESERG